MKTYDMSKTESEQWYNNALVQHPSNLPTTAQHCRQLIEQNANDRGCQTIKCHLGNTVRR